MHPNVSALLAALPPSQNPFAALDQALHQELYADVPHKMKVAVFFFLALLALYAVSLTRSRRF